MGIYRPISKGDKFFFDRTVAKEMAKSIPNSNQSPTIEEASLWVGQEVYNVKAYGAGGAGASDDTSAINDAITALEANGGGTLFFPPGTYNVSSTLQVDIDPNTCKFVEICGAGANSVINYTAEDGTDCLYILGTATTGIKMLDIHDIQLTGAGKTSNTGNGLHLRRCIMPKSIKQVAINKFGGGSGIKIQSSWVNNIYSCYIQECGYGVEITNDSVSGGWGSTVNTKIEACMLEFSVNYGVYVPNIDDDYTVSHTEVINNIIEGNSEGGVSAYGMIDFKIHSNYFETNNDGNSPVGDIHLDKCIFGTIENNGFHPGAGPDTSIDTDTNCSRMTLTCNNVQGTTNLLGTYINTEFTKWDTRGTYYQYETPTNKDTALPANDATPTVYVSPPSTFFYTANTEATTITDFDDGFIGQEIIVYVNDTNTTFDFSGTSLKGNAGADFTGAVGDVLKFVLYGTNWYGVVIDIA